MGFVSIPKRRFSHDHIDVVFLEDKSKGSLFKFPLPLGILRPMSARFHDTMRFLRKMTPGKVVNALQLVISFYWTKWTRHHWHWGQPLGISFEPTTACNLRCPECPSGLRAFTRDTGNLKKDFFRSTVDQVAERLASLTFYFQGEPYINPAFLDMVSYAHGKGIYTVTSTNAHFLDDDNCKKTIESGLDRIIISIDGTTQEVYEQYRKSGQLSKVLEGTRNLIAWKKKMKAHQPYVIWQFLVVAPNEHQIDEVMEMSKEFGVDEVKYKTAQLYDYAKGNPLMPSIERYSRYKKSADGTYRLKYALTNDCWKMWHSCVVTWNGLVVPCCFDKDAQHILGDTREHDLMTVWKSDKARKFRKQLLKGRSEIEICANCSEGCSVWA